MHVELLTERELAHLLGISVRTVQGQRMTGQGIPFIRIGRSVRYRKDDIEAVLERRFRSTAEEAAEQSAAG